jgi:predicted RNA-binding protein with PIN domain
MPHVIDGDNLLGTWPGRSRSDAEKRKLVREVWQLARIEHRRIVVVFDGSPPPGVSYGSQVLFSGPGRNADAVILEFLRAQIDRRGWTIVTSDRPLADQSRFLGAQVESTRTFRDRLGRDVSEEKPDTPGDLDYWLEQFDKEGGETPR